MISKVIKIPLFPTEVRLSEKQRPKYWECNRMNGDIKCGSKPLGKRLSIQFVAGTVILNKDNILCNTNYKPIIANPTQAGKPRIKQMKLNDIYATSGKMVFITRKITRTIKDHCAEYIKTHTPVEKGMYPLHIEIRVYNTIGANHLKPEWYKQRWDGTNIAHLYEKPLIDLLCNSDKKGKLYDFKPIIQDDDRLMVTANSKFIPLPKGKTYEDRYIIIKITKETDPEIINNEYIKEFYTKYFK
jgi:hypothetical protein